MKTAALIARILLGLVFVVFSVNGLMMLYTGKGFIPMPALHEGVAKNFSTILFTTGYLKVVKFIELIGGLLVLSGRYLNLGIFLLGPIVVNIFLYHLLMDRAGLPMGAALLGLTLFLAFCNRKSWTAVLC